ncbi:hypothetical protein [Cronobacter dublinensis]|uniref:hypothetical protein n=1 Tax=Cronobacter dublinensis TaxID=413497 RepID=UPI00300E5FF6
MKKDALKYETGYRNQENSQALLILFLCLFERRIKNTLAMTKKRRQADEPDAVNAL